MSSKNLNQTQRLFGELSIKTKSTASVTNPTSSPSAASSNGVNGCGTDTHGPYRLMNSSAYKNQSPEIHDLIRFQNAIMLKYYHTHDQHFKNIADALKPQIEDKIRDFHRNN